MVYQVIRVIQELQERLGIEERLEPKDQEVQEVIQEYEVHQDYLDKKVFGETKASEALMALEVLLVWLVFEDRKVYQALQELLVCVVQ